MADVKLTTSIIVLCVNGVNISFKRQQLSDNKKTMFNYICL